VVKWQIPDLPWRWFPVAGQHDRVRITLSVGGNDLLFGEYVQACLLRVPWKTCDKTVARINNLIDNTDGKDTLENSLVEVWKRLQYDTRAIISKWYVPPIIHTGYPEFFNAKDPKCNKKRILKVGPLLSEKLREDTNSLVRRANSKIEEHLKNFRNKEPRLRGHTQFVNYNDRWNGHRLCEPFVTASGPGFEDPEVWFLGVRGSDAKQQEETEYDINTCDPESTDIDHAFGCGLAIYAAQNPNEDLDEWYRISQEWIKKAFHPKSSGFEKVRDAIVSTWFGPRPALRVLALGDSITNGYKSSDEAGYRGVLYDYLTKQGVYKVDMIGSVKAGTMSDPDHEGHNGATIAQISRFADLSLGQRPNVVLLHAGTNDLGNDNDATGAVSRLADLIDKIIKKCPDAAILVAAIIPATDRARQGRTNTYNAGVAALVSSRAKAGKKVLLMNMDMVLTTAQLSDGLHPNDEGYAVMGTHWAGGINEAFQKGWIKDPGEFLPAAQILY
jgi:lysophospholipase L1-like esterase